MMTLDDLKLLQVRIISEFRVISLIWERTTAKQMKIIAGRSSAGDRGPQSEYGGRKNGDFQPA